MLGAVYHAMGDADRALEHYRRAVKLGPDAFAYSNMGMLFYSRGRLRDAAAAFEEASRLEPGEAAIRRNLGDTYRRLGDEQRARGAYGEAVRLNEERLRVDPNSPETLAALAVSEAKLAQFEQASQHVEKGRVLAPRHPEVLYKAAVVYSLAGRKEAALAALRSAIENGASTALARDDEDLIPLRGSPDFNRLTAPKHP
jgi:Flp pilus assembly protein TadD